MTTGPSDDSDPVLSPDGSRVASSSRDGRVKRLIVRPVGAGDSTVLVEDTFNKYASSWSADGESVLFTHFRGSGRGGLDITMAKANGPAVRVVATPASESRAQLSPDGRFIAYQSSESGRYEVYVAAYPDVKTNWPVSSGGGADPAWSRDGSELYFVTPTSLVRTRVVPWGSALEIGAVEPVIDLRLAESIVNARVRSPGPGQSAILTARRREKTAELLVVRSREQPPTHTRQRHQCVDGRLLAVTRRQVHRLPDGQERRRGVSVGELPDAGGWLPPVGASLARQAGGFTSSCRGYNR